MRALLILAVLSLAGSAAAQPDFGLLQARESQLAAEAEAARLRDIELTNRLSVLDAQLRTEQALRDLQAMSQRPAPLAAYGVPGAPPPMIDTSALASIPDAALAASNARVRAAASNRR